MRVSHQGEAILNDMLDNIERRIDAPWNKVPPPEKGQQ
jgi:hypothetical protein